MTNHFPTMHLIKENNNSNINIEFDKAEIRNIINIDHLNMLLSIES